MGRKQDVMAADRAAVSSRTETEEFVAQFSRCHERLFGYIYSLVPHEQDARDIFQRVSLLLWRKYSSFDAEADFFAWACGVAYYEVRNFFRVSARSRLKFNDELLNTLAVEKARRGSEDRRLEALQECLKELPSAERKLLMEVYGDGRPIHEVANECGKAVQTVYNRLNLIRRKLYARMQRALTEN
ncbi:MAG: sigma-70 family RNA polymerase sigma factor [Thermogutta sp.]|nr:sigma-70 family RNA polymerase sigma factor [Thermogutta sp.]